MMDDLLQVTIGLLYSWRKLTKWVMAMSDLIRREKKVMVRMTDDMYEKLEKYADKYGHAPAALAAFAVSSWIVGQERSEDQIRAIADMVGKGMVEFAEKQAEGVDIEAFLKGVGGLSPDPRSHLSQLHEATKAGAVKGAE